ncbi:hypothetical protein O181_128729 [Austropuccinia psidii MF-1]|uniref:Uncharacterized protein n=1 Tax=Austropuccinia psidii MF-1 TaxID=1389203 RepID=A0A9Q3L0K6_9BASI|nr:hypothetical protein [Austropuccinia psidii MF-1]
MNHQDRSYGSVYSNFINAFSTNELEELLFGFPSPSSSRTGFWDWVNNPQSNSPSPPALETLSKASSPSSSLENVPEAAVAFYAFIEGKYDPRLFVPNPLSYFLGEETPSNGSIKANCGYKRHFHPYNLCPRDSSG